MQHLPYLTRDERDREAVVKVDERGADLHEGNSTKHDKAGKREVVAIGESRGCEHALPDSCEATKKC